jgi:hypothetical protein
VQVYVAAVPGEGEPLGPELAVHAGVEPSVALMAQAMVALVPGQGLEVVGGLTVAVKTRSPLGVEQPEAQGGPLLPGATVTSTLGEGLVRTTVDDDDEPLGYEGPE